MGQGGSSKWVRWGEPGGSQGVSQVGQSEAVWVREGHTVGQGVSGCDLTEQWYCTQAGHGARDE